MKVHARKVQSVGYSSLSVSLPKGWAKRLGLKPGDIVSLVEMDDGSLSLRPGLAKEGGRTNERVVDAGSCDDEGLLSRILVGLYLTGADRIVVTSGSGLSREAAKEVRRVAGALNGFSLVEEGADRIVLQSIMDLAATPPRDLLRRMHGLAGRMIEGAYEALRSGDAGAAREVQSMEEELDRIYWLVTRQVLAAAARPELLERMDIGNPMHAVGDRLIAKLLEDAGDRAASMAMAAEEVARRGLRPVDMDVELLGKYTSEVLSVYESAFSCISSPRIRTANSIAENASKLEEELKGAAAALGFKYAGQEGAAALGLAMKSYLDDLAQVVRISRSLAEVAINRSLVDSERACEDRPDAGRGPG